MCGLTERQIRWLIKETFKGWVKEIREVRKLTPTDFELIREVRKFMKNPKWRVR